MGEIIIANSEKSNFQFKHPFTCLIAGATSCGKTTFLRKLLEKAAVMISPPPDKIVLFYKRWQPLYGLMGKNVKNISFHEGYDHPSNEVSTPTLYIYDDLMQVCSNNSSMDELFSEGSHHQNLSIICLLQNVFHKGTREMQLNSHYLVIFKNIRDQTQSKYLARQMYANDPNIFLSKYQNATQRPFGYLIVDLKQETADCDRLKSNIFDENNINLQDGACLAVTSLKSGESLPAPAATILKNGESLSVDTILKNEESLSNNIIEKQLFDCLISKVIKLNHNLYKRFLKDNLDVKNGNELLKNIYVDSLIKLYSDYVRNVGTVTLNRTKFYNKISHEMCLHINEYTLSDALNIVLENNRDYFIRIVEMYSS